MLSFIIILLLVFIVWPLIKFGWRVYTIQRQMKQAYRAATGQNARASQQRRPQSDAQPRRKGGWSTGYPSRKIIEKNEGEYVAFEEVTVSSASETASAPSADNGRVSVEISSQISDAEWEEIK